MAKGRKTGGRKKGSANKITQDLRAAILAAFDKVGGPKYLARIAVTHPPVFGALLAKIIPQVHTGPNGGPIPVERLDLSKLSNAELAELKRLRDLVDRLGVAAPPPEQDGPRRGGDSTRH